MDAIEKCRNETKQAMQGYDPSLIVNWDETRFAPYSNSNYSYQCTMSDGSSFPRKEQNQKKSFTLLCGISANYESVRPVFILQNFCRGFKKKDFLEQKITEDITRYKTNRFTVYINKKSNWMNSTIWEDILKLTNEKNKRRNESSLIIADNAPCHSNPVLSNVKLHFLIPRCTSQCQPADMLYIAEIKRTYKKWYNNRIDTDEIPDISKSIEQVVTIIEEIKSDIIEKSWFRSGLVGSSIDQFHDPDPFSTMFENQLNISDDRSLENENQVALVEDVQDEEIVLEPIIEKKNRQLSILDFYKK